MAHLIAMLVNSRCCLILYWEQLLLLKVVVGFVFPALPPFAGAVLVGSCFLPAHLPLWPPPGFVSLCTMFALNWFMSRVAVVVLSPLLSG